MDIALPPQHRYARALRDVADDLEAARDLEAFFDALDKNLTLWLGLHDCREGDLGRRLSREAAFVLRHSAKGRQGLPDGVVVTLISLNRRVAGELVRQAAAPAGEGTGPERA